MYCSDGSRHSLHYSCYWRGINANAEIRSSRARGLGGSLVGQRVQWQWTGTFAVGAQLVRMRPRLAYSDARDALAAGGRGGVAGHPRSGCGAIFLSSLGGQCEPAAYNDSRTPELRGSSSRLEDARDRPARPARAKRPDAKAPPEYDVARRWPALVDERCRAPALRKSPFTW